MPACGRPVAADRLYPPWSRGVFRQQGRVASPRIKVGADVLPWWPARGAYVLIEESAEPPALDIVEIPGVGGAWWATAIQHETQHRPDDNGSLQITYCYLDDDPPATARAGWQATSRSAGPALVPYRFWPRRSTPSPATSGTAICPDLH